MTVVRCPICGNSANVDAELQGGEQLDCPYCNRTFTYGRKKDVSSQEVRPANSAPQRVDLPSAGGGTPIQQTNAQSNSGKLSSMRTQRESSRAERITVPSRFARPKQGEVSDSYSGAQKTKSAKKKWLMLIGLIVGGLIIAGVGAVGAYQFFADEPRLCRGIAYYEKGAHSKAYKLLLPLANAGYARAQLYIGDCYANGLGVFLDKEEAVKWYRKAADQDMPEAQHRMFVCCGDGAGIERNLSNAVKWCRKAAEAGLEEAIYDMGMIYVEGRGVECNAKSAFKWFRKGAERGHPGCLYKLGQCYKYGFGVEKDEDEASKWQEKAVALWQESAKSGNAAAMVWLAELYTKGDVVEINKEEAAKWYRKAAELDHTLAQQHLALCYFNGDGVEEDREEAAKWMLKAAEKGISSEIQWGMGRYYQEGWGVEKNPKEAVKWFERSAKKGFSLAKYYLAMCYMNGEGVQEDEEKAEELLEEAAVAGCKEAKDELARIKKEREEQARRLASEHAEKIDQIDRLKRIEGAVEERIERINDILAGRLSGEWAGFNASKISVVDSSASIKEEPQLSLLSEQLSIEDTFEKIKQAIDITIREADRLDERLAKITDIKKKYDESLKELCRPCMGSGTISCAQCSGSGSISVFEQIPCPNCNNAEYDYGYDDEDDFVSSPTMKKSGQVQRQEKCANCNGKGLINQRCATCRGTGKVRCSNCGGHNIVNLNKCPYCKSGKVTCDTCGGSGKDDPKRCPKCSGRGTVAVWRACAKCKGRGRVKKEKKETCPACRGTGNQKCELCNGDGYTYRTTE